MSLTSSGEEDRPRLTAATMLVRLGGIVCESCDMTCCTQLMHEMALIHSFQHDAGDNDVFQSH